MKHVILVITIIFGTPFLEARWVESARKTEISSVAKAKVKPIVEVKEKDLGLKYVKKKWHSLKGKAKNFWNSWSDRNEAKKSVKENEKQVSPPNLPSQKLSAKEQAKAAADKERDQKEKLIATEKLAAKTKTENETAKQVQKKLSSMPTYNSEVRGVYNEQLLKASKVLSENALFNSVGAVAGDSQLGKTVHGVPLGNFPVANKKKHRKKRVNFKTAKVPLLDLGLVPTVERASFVTPEMKLGIDRFERTKRLKSPKVLSRNELRRIKKKFFRLAARPKTLKERNLDTGIFVNQKRVDQLVYILGAPNDTALKANDVMSSTETKMLAVLIINRKGDLCHMVVGYLNDLVSTKEFKDRARYQLGMCADKMGLHGATTKNLISTISKGQVTKQERALALEALLSDLPANYGGEIWSSLNSIAGSLGEIEAKVIDNFNYILAKEALRSGKVKSAYYLSNKVSEKSDFYNESQFLMALSLFERNKISQAATLLETVAKRLKQNLGNSGKNLEALVFINLGRVYFYLKKYKQSLAYYLKIPKDHSLWVQGLIEQGWVQLGMGDYSGAIGNMYSLHSPYFKAVYIPESFVIRTIGYLSICQYGDAYRTLAFMDKTHKKWLQGMKTFLKTHKKPSKSYLSAKKYLTGKSTQGVSGLAYQVIREIVRQKKFLNLQGAINQFEDERDQYKFISNLILSEKRKLYTELKDARRRLNQAKAAVIVSRKKKEVTLLSKEDWNRTIKNENQRIHRLRSRIFFYKKSAMSYKKFRKVGMRALVRKKMKYKRLAGVQIYQSVKAMTSQLVGILDNNEFLRYEIFAGSGENIRYQVAGGKTSEVKRIPAHVRPEKIMNWAFEGEFWADEIGSYRSTLRNNCPQSGSGAMSGINESKKGG